MGVVFAVLALLALSIKVLGMFDRDQVAYAGASASASSSTSPSESSISGEITGQQVAAIAVALALAEPKSSQVPGSPVSRPSAPGSSGLSTGSWLQSGRMRALGAALNPMGRRRQ